MAKSALPLILGVGAIALIATSGKKSTKKKPGPLPEPDDLDDADDGEDTYVTPPPEEKKSSGGGGGRPSGNPPRGDTYDGSYWGGTTDARLSNIRNHFKELGYNVKVGPWPMNVMGPAKGAAGATMEYTNEDGTKGWSGGYDDQPSAIVKQFQQDYNRVSRLNKMENIYSQSMGGLDADGKVGPYTLNGLRYASEGLPGGKTWNDLLQQATLKGIG